MGLELRGHPPKRELGYAEITSSFVQATAGGATVYDVPGLATTVTVGSHPIIVEAWAQSFLSNTANAGPQLRLYEGTTILAITTVSLAQANLGGVVYVRVRLAPSPGEHTYKVAMWGQPGHSVTLTAASLSPAHIQVREC